MSRLAETCSLKGTYFFIIIFQPPSLQRQVGIESIEDPGIVKYVGNSVCHCRNIPLIVEFTLERNLTVVKSVGKLFHANTLCKDIWVHMKMKKRKFHKSMLP